MLTENPPAKLKRFYALLSLACADAGWSPCSTAQGIQAAVTELLEDLERAAQVERIPDGRYRVVKVKRRGDPEPLTGR